MKYIRHILLLSILFISFYCVLLQKKAKIKPIPFHYDQIAQNYFSYQNEKPFPLTVQRGNNLYNSTTLDGKYLFYTTDNKGNYDIWFRDLQSSIIVPVTEHPAAEYKPAISPDGRKLVFVSDQYDSEGDLVFLKMDDPGDWVQKMLKGKRFINQDFVFLTNLDKKDHFVDTEPAWSSDGNSIVFSSNRLSPGLQNIVIYNLNTKQFRLVTKKGGTSPFWSLDGRYIVYLSFKDSKYGEIYQLELATGKEWRLTNNNFMEFSPSLSPDNKYMIYTSIREDTNKNGELDARDNSYIVRYYMEKKREDFLSTGKTSIFDTKYSSFNNGSILYSAALYNSINIYFIPFLGSIPKQSDIKKQYKYALNYRDTQSVENYNLALDSVKLFFENDALYPVFHSKVDMAKVEKLWELGRKGEANLILEKMQSESKNKKFGLSYAYAYSFQKDAKNKEEIIPGLNKYLNEFPRSQETEQVNASIMDFMGDEMVRLDKEEEANRKFQIILSEHSKYYNIQDVKRKIGALSFHPKESHVLPKEYIELINSGDTEIENVIKIQNDIEDKILSLDISSSEKYDLIDKIIDSNALSKNSKKLDDFFVYLKSVSLTEGKKFAESNFLLESFLPKLPESDNATVPVDPILPETDPMKKDPLFLKSHILKSKNYENLGNFSDYFKELWVYLLNYDPELGVMLNKKDMENSFRYYEAQAKDFEDKVAKMEMDASQTKDKAIQDEELYKSYLRNVAFRYFYNAKNIYLMKTNGLFVNTLYKDYAIYYHKKMMDSVLKFGKKALKLSDDDLLNQLNILGRNRLDVLGRTTSFLSLLLNNKYTNKFNFLGDFRDLRKHDILDPQATYLIENFYAKDFLPKSRPSLDLAAVYGYAYYLINKGVLYENYYNQVDVMTPARKAEVFQYLKKAEYELKWIIFADPQFTDAYQLLGWLYQQIDIVKSLPLSPGDDTTDGELYASVYEKYFPERHFEENIDLYLQILNFLGDDYPNKKVLSDLHLNLGNNYYLLNNYSKARDHYGISEQYEDSVNPYVRFDNYKQEALFYYNYAKTNLYLADYKKATENLKKAIRIYYEKEYYKAVAASNQLDEKGEKDDRALKEVSGKFVLLYALSGLSQMELQNYKEAIHYFNRSLSFNSSTNYVDNINIYNMLAICHQKMNHFSESEKYLQLAEKEYKEGRGTNKKSSTGFLWNWVLPEKNRIIGDGRFPGAFPIEYHRLLSYGIDAQNNLLQKEYSTANQLYKDRNEFIDDKNLEKSVTGQQIINNTLRNQAYNEFQRGDYEKSLSIYKQIYEESQKNNKKAEYIKTFNRYNHTLFKYIESGKGELKYLTELIKQNIAGFSKIKGSYMKSCLEQSKYSEIQRKQVVQLCLAEFSKEFRDFDPLQGLNYFYLGEVLKKQGSEISAFYYYGLASSVLENPAKVPEDQIGLSQDVFNRLERIRLKINVANVYFRLQEKDKFLTVIREAEDMAYQFQAFEEFAVIKLLYARFLLQNKSQKDFSKIEKLLAESETTVLSNYGLTYTMPSDFFKSLYDAMMLKDIQKNKYNDLYKYQEKLQNIVLFKDFITNRFEFEDSSLNRYYNQLSTKIQKSVFLNEELEKLNMQRKSIKLVNPLVEKLEKHNNTITEIVKKLADLFPERNDFFVFEETIKPSQYLANDEIWFRFLVYQNELVYWKITKNTIQTFHKQITQNIKKEIESVFEKEQNFINQYQKIIITPDTHTIVVDFGKNKVLQNKEVYYSYKSSHLKKASKANHVKLKKSAIIVSSDKVKQAKPIVTAAKMHSKKSLEELAYLTDILETPINYKLMENNVFGESVEGYLNLREIFEKNTDLSMVMINNASFDGYHYEKLVSAIDILRGAGIPVVYLLSPDEKNKMPSLQDGNSLLRNRNNFVSIGLKDVQNKELSSDKQKYQHYKELGYKAERTKNYELALENFDIASGMINRNDFKTFLESEINLTRLKSKYYNFPGDKEFYFYENLLDDYKNKEDGTFQIYNSLLTYCHTSEKEKDCQKYNKQFLEIIKRRMEAKKELPNTTSVLFFQLVDGGKLNDFDKYYQQYLKFNTMEDGFLFHYDLSTFFLKNFLLSESELHAKKALSFSATENEKKVIYDRLSEIALQENFIKQKNKTITNIDDKDSVYTLGTREKWDEFDKKVDEIYNSQKKESDIIVLTYQKKVYNLWRLASIGGDYDPLYLTPDKTGEGISVFYYLSSTDLSLVYNVLHQSIQYQVTDEINSIFDILSKHLEQTGNLLMPAYMMVSWAEELCHQGDYKKANDYIQKFEKEYLKLKLPSDIINQYHFLKFKYSYLTSQENKQIPNIYDENKIWFSKYIEASKLKQANQILPFLASAIQQIGSQDFNLKHHKELLDLITFLQTRAFNLNSSEAFLDLGFYRDKIDSFNKRIYSNKIRFSDIPVPRSITEDLFQKLPKNQQLLAVLNHGTKVFFVSVYGGKTRGDDAKIDNREFHNEIIQYYRAINENGSFALQKDFIESKFRNAIFKNPIINPILNEEPITYLYLSSYLIKVPLEFREKDNFFYIQSPELLAQRQSHSLSGDFEKDFKINLHWNKTNTSTAYTEFKKIGNYELDSEGNNTKSVVNVSGEDLGIKNQNQLYFGTQPLQKLNLNHIRNGCWILASSELYETSIKNNDLNYSLAFLDKIHYGPGVISIGPQNNLGNLIFIKNLLQRKKVKLSLKDRFINSLKQQKITYPNEYSWIGYRLYTNTLLKE
ncbi:MAG: PD40 domain-containing protein [Leptospiraceae bacterium]|nr:PD40 domain-containing protein [Leptospiraceae bacterium]